MILPSPSRAESSRSSRAETVQPSRTYVATPDQPLRARENEKKESYPGTKACSRETSSHEEILVSWKQTMSAPYCANRAGKGLARMLIERRPLMFQLRMVSASEPLPTVVIVGSGSEEVDEAAAAAAAAEEAGSAAPLLEGRAALMAALTVAMLRECVPG